MTRYAGATCAPSSRPMTVGLRIAGVKKSASRRGYAAPLSTRRPLPALNVASLSPGLIPRDQLHGLALAIRPCSHVARANRRIIRLRKRRERDDGGQGHGSDQLAHDLSPSRYVNSLGTGWRPLETATVDRAQCGPRMLLVSGRPE